MDVKLFEIRDKRTFIPVMAVRLFSFNDAERFLLWRAGYGDKEITLGCDLLKGIGLEPYIILCKLDGIEAHYDSHGWPNQRTMGEAHRHVIANWDGLRTGSVVDVEFILGESISPKSSERIEQGSVLTNLNTGATFDIPPVLSVEDINAMMRGEKPWPRKL